MGLGIPGVGGGGLKLPGMEQLGGFMNSPMGKMAMQAGLAAATGGTGNIALSMLGGGGGAGGASLLTSALSAGQGGGLDIGGAGNPLGAIGGNPLEMLGGAGGGANPLAMLGGGGEKAQGQGGGQDMIKMLLMLLLQGGQQGGQQGGAPKCGLPA